jgi:hypothetical protein
MRFEACIIKHCTYCFLLVIKFADNCFLECFDFLVKHPCLFENSVGHDE